MKAGLTGWQISTAEIEGPETFQAFLAQTLYDRLEALAHYAPVFAAPGFEFASWVKYPRDAQGRVVLPECVWGPEANGFVDMAYRFGWVLAPFDWSKWGNSEEARTLLAGPEHVSAASAEQLARLLTVFVRSDRFSEGALLDAFQNRFLTAIARRASVIGNQMGVKDA